MKFGEVENTPMLFGEKTNTAIVPFIKEGSVEIFLKKSDVLKTQSESRVQEQRKEIAKSAAERECKYFTLLFCRLAHKKFGFTLDALKQLTEEDLRVCIDEIRKTTKLRRKILKGAVIFFIPIVFIGWLIIDEIRGSKVYKFEGHYKKLEKFYGEHLPYGFMQTFINSNGIEESFENYRVSFSKGKEWDRF